MVIYMHMVKRKFWLQKIEEFWKRRSVIWLSGVRRVGKTFLCQSLSDIEYFDCELPSARRQMEDIEGFLERLKGKRIILDEIHRLKNPSELLKVAADHYKNVSIVATGSSTLWASAKFKDTLTGRKETLWLTPMIKDEYKDFGASDINHRLLRGGLPPFFMEEKFSERSFQEWIDSYWAKDIQELFRLEKRGAFQKFLELIFINSGGMFEATKYAVPCEVSRTSISNYLKVLESTYVAHILKPFSGRKTFEIVSAPKVYAFDTGFVCYFRGWDKLRTEDKGKLWEHLVLNEIMAHRQSRDINYWRDKQGHEIDFILRRRGGHVQVVECKWSCKDFNPRNLKIFRKSHGLGHNFVVSFDISRPFTRKFGELTVNFVNLKDLISSLVA